MKKIFLTAIALASGMCANADDVLSIVPFKTTTAAVTSVYDDDEEGFVEGEYFSVNLNYTKDYSAVEFDFYVPKGIFSFDSDNAVQPGAIAPVTKAGAMRHTTQIDVSGAAESIEGYDVFKCIAYNAKSTTYYFNADDSGLELFKIYYNKKAVAEGVYPIYMKNVSLSRGAGKTDIIPDVMSYFVVGEPTNQPLKAKGLICDFVNDALAQETAISSLDLTDVTAVDGDFAYVAGRDVVAPATAVEANVKYVAPAPAKYATLCLPVAATVDCWVLDRKEGDMAIFKESTVAPANTPVIIKAAVATDAAKANIAGVAKKSITSGAYLVGESLHTVNGNATIPALRGYWEDLAGSNCRIAFDTTTGIQVIGTAADIDSTYDLQGRQVQNAQNGVFVVNGKKQFVK